MLIESAQQHGTIAKDSSCTRILPPSLSQRSGFHVPSRIVEVSSLRGGRRTLPFTNAGLGHGKIVGNIARQDVTDWSMRTNDVGKIIRDKGR